MSGERPDTALAQEVIGFQLNGEEVAAVPGRDDHRSGDTPRRRDSAPLLHARACDPTATAARAWWRSRASACWRRPAAAHPPRGWKCRACRDAPLHAQKIIVEMLVADVPERVYKLDSELAAVAALSRHRQAALRRARAAGAGRLASRDGGQPRRLHPVHALRARVPRGAGQRRDRLRVPRRAFEDRVRSRRSDGRVDVCGVRRMRAGVPHRRARAREGGVPRAGRQESGVGLPYCGVGCQLTYHVNDNAIVRVEGRDGPANHERLCVKGRFGFDYVHHPQRLTKPLIR